jgi:hypothetical protein
MRILVIQHGNSWQATVRKDAVFEVGEFRPDYLGAILSATDKFQAAHPAPCKSPTDLGDLLK